MVILPSFLKLCDFTLTLHKTGAKSTKKMAKTGGKNVLTRGKRQFRLKMMRVKSQSLKIRVKSPLRFGAAAETHYSLLFIILSIDAHEHRWYIFLMIYPLAILDEILVTWTTIGSVYSNI